jgi:thymidylate kinase
MKNNKKKPYQKPKGKIIILEGLWGTGKTIICQYLQRFYNFSYIQEPNHIKSKIKAKDWMVITKWYFKEHLKNLKQAFELRNKGKNAVIERSPISSIAFAKAFFPENLFLKWEINLNKEVNKVENFLKKINSKPYLIFLKQTDFSFLAKILSKNKQMIIYSDLEFLKRFEKYLLFFINLFEKKNYFNVVILKSNKYFKKNLKILPQKFYEKIKNYLKSNNLS